MTEQQLFGNITGIICGTARADLCQNWNISEFRIFVSARWGTKPFCCFFCSSGMTCFLRDWLEVASFIHTVGTLILSVR